MKSLNFQEFDQYIRWCESIALGAQLQRVLSSQGLLVFEFYKLGQITLVLDLEMQSPQTILLQKSNLELKKTQSPVALFLNSHGKNLRLRSLKNLPDFGRVCKMILDSGEEDRGRKCEVEICMVPRIPNVTVRADAKSISWRRPVPLVKTNEKTVTQDAVEVDWAQREFEWLNYFLNKKKGLTSESGARKTRDIETVRLKKLRALEQLKQSIASDEEEKNLRSYAEALASHQEIAPSLQKYSNLTINQAYERIKKINLKKNGTEKRIQLLQEELEKLSAESKFPETTVEAPKFSISQKMEKAGTKGRKLKLTGNSEAVIGKSGKDNLLLLRQARAWDYWLHIKDYPGAHALIFRDRNATVPQSDLKKVAEWLVRESPSARGLEFGVAYDIILAECRYVKPLKGDRLGRVTYSEHKIFRFSSTRA